MTRSTIAPIAQVMRDPTTKRARGFGFITFADPMAVEKVLALESHELDGKRIDPKVAFPKKQQRKMVVKTKKVFIGGLSANSTLDDIKAYFAQYGKASRGGGGRGESQQTWMGQNLVDIQIEDAMLMFDKSTQRHRGQSVAVKGGKQWASLFWVSGFGFITFDDDEV